MYLFFVTEPMALHARRDPRDARFVVYERAAPGEADEVNEPPMLRLAPARDGRATGSTIYFAFSVPFLQQLAAIERTAERRSVCLLPDAECDRILGDPRMPARIGEVRDADGRAVPLASQLTALRPEGPLRVAVLNPFGFALGDSVVLLTALREARRVMAGRFGEIALDLFQHADNRETAGIYRRSGLVRAVHELPHPVGALASYDAYVDLSRGYRSHGLPWIDEMFEMLGLDPGEVPAERKRNAVALPDDIDRAWPSLGARVRATRASGAPVLLLHLRASTALRSMPADVAARLVDRLATAGEWRLVTTQPLPAADSRVDDWSPLSTNFERWCALVSGVDAILCVDTAVYHVADAFDVPAVVLFTSIAPDHRMHYYPRMQAVRLGHDGDRLTDKSDSVEPADLAYLAQAWDALDLERVVEMADSMQTSRSTARLDGHSHRSGEMAHGDA